MKSRKKTYLESHNWRKKSRQQLNHLRQQKVNGLPKRWECHLHVYFADDLFGEGDEDETKESKEVPKNVEVSSVVTERPHRDSEPPTLEPDVPETTPIVEPTPLPKDSTPVTTSGDDLFDEEEEEEPKPKQVS